MANFMNFNLKLMQYYELLAENGHNFVYWVRTLRMVLRNLEMEYILDAPLPVVPPALDMNGNRVKEFDDEVELKPSCWPT